MCARVSVRACACVCVCVCVCVKLNSSAAWALIPAARIHPKRHFAERVALLLRLGAGDPFDLCGWSDRFADAISINAKADVPGNWHPLWGWKRTLRQPRRQQQRRATQLSGKWQWQLRCRHKLRRRKILTSSTSVDGNAPNLVKKCAPCQTCLGK